MENSGSNHPPKAVKLIAAARTQVAQLVGR